VDNLAVDLAAISQNIQSVVLKYLRNANAEFGQRVASQIAVYAKR
jgi:catalase